VFIGGLLIGFFGFVGFVECFGEVSLLEEFVVGFCLLVCDWDVWFFVGVFGA